MNILFNFAFTKLRYLLQVTSDTAAYFADKILTNPTSDKSQNASIGRSRNSAHFVVAQMFSYFPNRNRVCFVCVKDKLSGGGSMCIFVRKMRTRCCFPSPRGC